MTLPNVDLKLLEQPTLDKVQAKELGKRALNPIAIF